MNVTVAHDFYCYSCTFKTHCCLYYVSVKVYLILDEFILAGELQETSKKVCLLPALALSIMRWKCSILITLASFAYCELCGYFRVTMLPLFLDMLLNSRQEVLDVSTSDFKSAQVQPTSAYISI